MNFISTQEFWSVKILDFYANCRVVKAREPDFYQGSVRLSPRPFVRCGLDWHAVASLADAIKLSPGLISQAVVAKVLYSDISF
jgi:hypothetical protein